MKPTINECEGCWRLTQIVAAAQIEAQGGFCTVDHGGHPLIDAIRTLRKQRASLPAETREERAVRFRESIPENERGKLTFDAWLAVADAASLYVYIPREMGGVDAEKVRLALAALRLPVSHEEARLRAISLLEEALGEKP